MEMKSKVEIRGHSFEIERNLDEPLHIFNKRKWFVAYLFPKTKEEYEDAVKWSNIWANTHFLKVVYNEEVMSILEDKVKLMNKDISKDI